MVDRVYKANVPALRKALEKLKREFSKIEPSTDWVKLRVEPLLLHARQLEHVLKSQRSSRLKRGVTMFHSDLVYLKMNVEGLKSVLQSEKNVFKRRNERHTKRGG
ncbi:MAG: hypothetical protein WA688_02740 [Thermoplasmata archaeon]